MQALDVLRLLADGEQHSGEALAGDLGITRSAVWKHVAKLGRLGLQVQSVRGRGYRLARPIELLSRQRILRGLRTETANRISHLEVFPQLDSTNEYLGRETPPVPGRLRVCLAEYQHAGRGRRGRRWLTPFGGGLCLSVGWVFQSMPRDVAALGLAAAVAARHVVGGLTGRAPWIKWPNDLVWEGRKLGGILVELSAECQGACHVVVGVGINVSMDAAWLRGASDWPGGAVDLHTLAGDGPPSRNETAAGLVEALLELLSAYASEGFTRYYDEFSAASYLRGKRVNVTDGERRLHGEVIGVEPDGALLLETGEGVRRVTAGDASVGLP